MLPEEPLEDALLGPSLQFPPRAPAFVSRPGHLDERLVQGQVVADGVLPPLAPFQAIVGVSGIEQVWSLAHFYFAGFSSNQGPVSKMFFTAVPPLLTTHRCSSFL